MFVVWPKPLVLPIRPMLAPSPPMDPLWKFTTSTFYISGDVGDIWSDVAAYVLQQGGWYVLNVRPQKACIKVECHGSSWSAGFVVKIRLSVTDTGLVAVEWQRRNGCAWKCNEAWLRFRSRFCQPLD